ncbi:MAG: DNA-3-methyladenine glycosylase [Candidatus Binatota bacterium]|jgi:DNA-3-methyladenine glycosylase|nr:DNA-3-methyladenine glycosylase [Candidatus Binatota bacterium]
MTPPKRALAERRWPPDLEEVLGGQPSPLPQEFYRRPTLRVARDLLGCILVHRTSDGATAGLVVEVEAYRGPKDRGAHSFGGRRTARNEVMYGAPGYAYVYFTYGMHFCMNVVTEEEGRPEAVLLRALRPLAGVALMRRRRSLDRDVPAERLARGPGNLCRAMGIDRSRNGADLTAGDLSLYAGETIRGAAVARSPRIGIDYAGEWAGRPWRWFLRDDPAVSRARVSGTAVGFERVRRVLS